MGDLWRSKNRITESGIFKEKINGICYIPLQQKVVLQPLR